ncbi:MAG: FtsW/RodA/SpoVE family cell cycle protein [Christensenellales bacterium]|jgi:cell division protein FtsW
MKTKQIDYVVLIIVIALALFGVLMVFSATFYTEQVKASSGLDSAIKQGILATTGMLIMLSISYVPFRTYNRFRIRGNPVIPIFVALISAGLLLYCILVGIIEGRGINGAQRWLTIFGISVQPSEIGRFAVLLFVADDLAHKKQDIPGCKNIIELVKLLFPSFLITGIISLLIIAGRSMSMCMTTLFLFACLLSAAGVKWQHLGIFAIIGGVAAVAMVFMEDYRVARVLIFRDPWRDTQGDGYQLIQSLYALANGGLFGVGPGNSRQKLSYLTYGESDFILSIIGEEYGFIGVLILLAAFALLVFRGYRIANYQSDAFGSFLAVGVTSTIWLQLVIHCLVVTSSMPPTGVPLPFISAGGTSMWIFMAQTGILLNISRYNRLL